MQKRHLVALTALFGFLAMGALVPLPEGGDSAVSKVYHTTTEQTTSLTNNGAACTTPGGASCTVILPTTEVSGWARLTVYVKSSGAATIDDVLVEVSPDGTNWDEVQDNTLDTIATTLTKTVTFVGIYKFMRVEARAAADTQAKVWVSLGTP